MEESGGVSRDRIIEFLRDLDALVSRAHELHIIGGSAITLFYSADNRTSDIDAVRVDDELELLGGRNSDLARSHGVHLQLLYDLTFTAPKDWMDHCKEVELSLNRIKVFVADPNDITLGKIARLETGDFDDIQALVDRSVIDASSVLARLKENLHEVEASPEYRNNAILLFSAVFTQDLVFQDGTATVRPGP